MANPVTDLGYTSVYTRQPGFTWNGRYTRRNHQIQAKPYNLILGYESFRGAIAQFYTTSTSTSDGPIGTPIDQFPGNVDFNTALNRSYAKLKDNLYNTAGLGVDLVEYRQSVSMIVSTCYSLTKAFRQVKALRFGDAAKTLRMKFIPKGVDWRKSVGSNWLEFHFGWEPLVKDIHEALDVWINPVNHFSNAKERAGYHFNSPVSVDDYGSGSLTTSMSGRIFTQQGVRAAVITNATQHRLEQFGISNPASLAWEVVPFSFVVDWFANVGTFLSSYTDFAGMDLQGAYKTKGYKITTTASYRNNPGYAPLFKSWNVKYSYMFRTAGLSGVTLEVKKLRPPSAVRGATAIALLLQTFAPRKTVSLGLQKRFRTNSQSQVVYY